MTLCAACGTAAHDEDRFCRVCGAVLAQQRTAELRERRTVVVLFVDLVGWTPLAERLDPELLRQILDRYYAACTQCFAEYGGLVEKFVGDAVMAIFGATTTHEDDALRAVRTASAIIYALRALGEVFSDLGLDTELRVHCGVAAGEVVVTTAVGAHLRFAGDAVNLASRLQSLAEPDEILVNAEVAELLRPFSELQRLPAMTVKGKAAPVPVWRVERLGMWGNTPAPERTAFIGRKPHLEILSKAFDRCVRESECVQLDVTGPAGVGKSRLVREFLARHALVRPLVMVGVCRSYGADLTYDPLITMLTEAQGGWGEAGRVLDHDAEGRRARRCLESLMRGPGPERPVAGGSGEIAWSTAILARRLSVQHPVILIWEDLHNARQGLLEFLDTVGDYLRRAHILMLHVYRRDPAGPSVPPIGSERIEVGQLSQTEVFELVGRLVGQSEVQAQDAAVVRVAELADGNPLFATALADVYVERGEVAALPSTVAAVLRARIDTLPATERLVLQWVSVCEETEQGQLAALMAEHRGQPGYETLTPAAMGDALTGLLARGVIEHRSNSHYRVAQVLMRETAYSMIPKTVRARLHALLAREAGVRLSAGEHTIGLLHSVIHHAETAGILLREVRPGDPSGAELTDQAARLLVMEGSVALHRNDLGASTSLLRRAMTLVNPASDLLQMLVVRLCDALMAQGENEEVLSLLEMVEAFKATARCRRTVKLERSMVLLHDAAIGYEQAAELGEGFESELATDPSDNVGWCLLYQFRAHTDLMQGRIQQAEHRFMSALDHAAGERDRYTEDRLFGALCELTQWSPRNAAAGLELCARAVQRFEADRLLLIPVLLAHARLLALRDELDEAWVDLRTAKAHATDLRATFFGIAIDEACAIVESMVGNSAHAYDMFRSAAGRLRGQGHAQAAHTLEVFAVREAFRMGEPETATRHLANLGAAVSEQHSSESARVWTALLNARLLYVRGRAADAIGQVLEAAESIVGDDPCLHGDAWFEAAEICALAGDERRSAEAAARALAQYQVKGATLLIRRLHIWASHSHVRIADLKGSTWT